VHTPEKRSAAGYSSANCSCETEKVTFSRILVAATTARRFAHTGHIHLRSCAGENGIYGRVHASTIAADRMHVFIISECMFVSGPTEKKPATMCI
jgi:hypothetical protein